MTIRTDPRAETAKRAVALVFAVNGFAFASWAGRTPGIKADLELDASGLGLLLVCASIGAMSSMPLTGAIVHTFGPRRAVLLGAAMESTGFAGVALGLALDSPVVTGAFLFLSGAGISVWDVAMNVEGAAVERQLGRSLMSRFHAGFSLGTVLGAGAAALCAAAGVTVAWQIALTALLVAVLAVVGVASFTPDEIVEEDPTAQPGERVTSRSLVWSAWKTPRTIIVGLMVLAFAFTEGVANDWSAVAVVDGLGVDEAAGAITFGVFVAAMTLGRVFGDQLIDRWGRVLVLRASVLTAAVGLLAVVVAPVWWLVVAGTVLWGLGAALGFPTGMSAAADHPTAAAIHVSVVSAIGYAAFLVGPPLVGFLGDRIGVRDSLSVVWVALAIALVTSGAARPLSPKVR